MKEEQDKDPNIAELKAVLQHGDPSKHLQRRYILLDGILSYISVPDDDPCSKLVKTIGDHPIQGKKLGHMGVQKTFDNIKKWYSWSNLFKEINDYVTSCVTCQTRSKYTINQPLQESDFPLYPFAKESLDISGPYSTTLSGNKYNIASVDWHSGWGKAFAVPDKSETVAHLLIDDIMTRYGCPLQLVADNGSGNVNKIMKDFRS